MNNGTIFSKSYGSAGATKQGLIVEPRGAYVRATNLPANWRRCRLVALVSFTRTSAENSDMVSETVVTNGTERLRYHFGLSNGAGMPGDADVKFVGLSQPANRHMKIFLNGYYGWMLANDDAYGTEVVGCVAAGATVGRGGGDTQDWRINPAATTDCALALMADMEVYPDGRLFTYAHNAKISDLAPTQMHLTLASTPSSNARRETGGGWWSNSVGVDCRHVFIRFPFTTNRLRLFGVEVMQLA